MTIDSVSMAPAELFDRAGRALFGDQYVAPMAALLDVEEKTVRNWRDGKSRILPGTWAIVSFEMNRRGWPAYFGLGKPLDRR